MCQGCSGSDQEPKASNKPESNQQLASIPKESEPDLTVEEDGAEYELMEIEELKELVPSLIEDRKWDEAEEVVTLLLEDDTEPLQYHFWSGKIFFESQRYGESMDEFAYIIAADPGQASSYLPEIQPFFERGKEISLTLARKLHTQTKKEMIIEVLFPMLKLYPEMNQEIFGSLAPSGDTPPKKLTYYVVIAIEYCREKLREEKSFWLYYQSGFLHRWMGWFSDSRRDLAKALSLADTQFQIFFALQFQEILQELAPKGPSTDLDKLAALDLNEDMLDEFLQKYSKDLTETQIQKAREVMKMGMKLKDRLERADGDREKLTVLKDFKELSAEILNKEQFPPDIRVKVERGQKQALKRYEELKEQIRVKEEALKGI
jgi:tetratricopeptide (TPR) repeat protein